MAFLSGDEIDELEAGATQAAHTQGVLNNPSPPQSTFSPWDSGAGSMIGAGNLSGDLNGDGLDDTTGYAVGVVADSNSPSGFSYNGTPTYSNGGLYMPSATPPATFGPAGPSEPFFSPWDTGAGTMIGAGNAIDPGAAAMARGDIGAYYEGLDEYLKNGINGPNLSPDWLEANQELIDPSYNPTSAGYNNWGLWNQNPPPIFSPQDARYALNYGGGQDQYLAPFTTPSDYGEPYNSLPGQGSFSVDPNAILDPSQTNYLSDSGETKPFYWPRWVPHLLGDTGPTQPTTGGIDYQTGHDLLNYGAAAQGADYFRPNWDVFNTPDQAIHDPYAQYRDALGNVNGVVDPYNPAVNPETAREDIYGSASSGGNPFNVVATGLLNQWNVPGADIIGPSIGTLADAATFGAGSGMAGGNMDVYDPAFWGEAGMAAANAGSLGLGGGIIKNAGANIAGNLAGKYIPQGLQQYSETNLPGADIAGNPYVQTGAGILGAIGAGVAGYAGAGALASGVKRAPGAFDKAITGLDARINEPAFSPEQPMVFSTGRKAGPERTVIPDSTSTDALQAWQRANMEFGKGSPEETAALQAFREVENGGITGRPQPLANDRLWFHSTRDMSYDLPDPDLAVGTQTGITQGPGIYMAADPAKSAGRYGPRTFVTEFDGKVLDLTKPMRPDEPFFPGGPSWETVRTQLRDIVEKKARTAGPNVRYAFDDALASLDEAFTPESLRAALKNVNAESAAHSWQGTNGYVYRQSLLDALGASGRTVEGSSIVGALPESAYGRFKGVGPGQIQGGAADLRNRGLAVLNNKLADNGVDALFHHSPRADGDVLIVLNGEKARVVADVKNAPDAVKAGATLRDIKRGVASKVLEGSDKELRVTDYGDRFRLADRNGNVLGSAYLDTPSDTWKASRYVGLGKNEVTDVASRADAEKWIREGAASERSTPTTSIRTFGQRVSDETGALDMGAIGARVQAAAPYFGTIGKEAARVAGHAAVGATAGAATGAYVSGGDPDAILKGALYGAAGGALFRVGAGTAGKLAERGIAERAAQRAVALGVPEPPPAVSKLATLIREAKPARETAEELKSAALAQKAAKLHGVYGSASGEAAFRKAPSALAGELPKGQFEAPRLSFSTNEVDDLFNHIVNNPLVTGPNKEKIFNVFNTQGALAKVLAGELPTNGEIQLLEKAFGPDVAKALLAKRSLGAKAFEVAMDAINMPRSLITSWDASAPLRQGAILFAGHPITGIKSTGTMVKAMASPKYAKYVDDGIQASPFAPELERMKVYFAPLDQSASVAAREEAIASRIVGHVPGIGGSQRGYTTFLNKMRQDVAENWLKTLTPEQRSNTALLEQMGNWINIASGRGKLPAVADRIVSVSSGAFFAPRYAISRLQVPVEFFRAVTPGSMGASVRKEIIRDMVGFIGTGTAILALGNKAGYWEAETDPRSTDFGKIRIGPTRWDLWAGEQQPIRTIAQIATRQRKSTSTGAIIPTDRSDTLLRFLRSKMSPAASAAWDLSEGKTFIGQEITSDKATVGQQAYQRLMPLLVQDIAEAWMEDGWKSGLRAGASATGIGVQTYFTNRDIQNKVADEMFGKTYLDLLKGERDVVNNDPRVKQVTAGFDNTVKINPDQAFQQKDDYYKKREAELRASIEAGMTGEALRNAVSELKSDRWVAADALLNSPEVQKVLNSGTPNTQVLDILAAAYWEAPVPKDPVTGQLDFRARDETRAGILQQMKDAGLDTYITGTGLTGLEYLQGTGKGTYRGTRFDDPVVRDAVTRVEKMSDNLEASGYYGITDYAWNTSKAKAPDAGPYATYYDYRDAVIANWQQQYMAQGKTETEALDMAAKAFAKTPVADEQAKLVHDANLNWIKENTALAYDAWKAGYIDFSSWNKDEKAVIAAYERSLGR